jgi:hypothetical protein
VQPSRLIAPAAREAAKRLPSELLIRALMNSKLAQPRNDALSLFFKMPDSRSVRISCLFSFEIAQSEKRLIVMPLLEIG